MIDYYVGLKEVRLTIPESDSRRYSVHDTLFAKVIQLRAEAIQGNIPGAVARVARPNAITDVAAFLEERRASPFRVSLAGVAVGQ